MATISDSTVFNSREELIENKFNKIKYALFNPESFSDSTQDIFSAFQNNLSSSDSDNNTEYRANSGLNKTFVNARESISYQYHELQEFFNTLSLEKVLSSSLKVLNKILNIDPNAVSFELTSDKSIIFVIKVNVFTFFYQVFLDHDEEEDEAILSIYNKKEKMPSYAGSKDELFNIISEKYIKRTSIQIEAVLNDLPL